MKEWDEVKYSTFSSFTIDDPNKPDEIEKLSRQSMIVMGIAAASLVYWLFLGSGEFLLTGAQIIINGFLLYAGVTGYYATKEKVQAKIRLYFKLLALSLILSLLALAVIVQKLRKLYQESDKCDPTKSDCSTNGSIVKMLFICLLTCVSIVYSGYAAFTTWKYTRENESN